MTSESPIALLIRAGARAAVYVTPRETSRAANDDMRQREVPLDVHVDSKCAISGSFRVSSWMGRANDEAVRAVQG